MAWVRDVVGKEAQTAPLRLSPCSKRPLIEKIDDEFLLKRRKRESYLQDSARFNPHEHLKKSSENTKKLINKMPDKKVFTVCALCDLNFLTELELEEHLFSLLHHRALDTEKGKDFVHECNLCRSRCKGLSEYVAHLRDEKHKENVDRRKEDIDKNKRSAPINDLAKYQDTFKYSPKNNQQSKSTPSKNTKVLKDKNRITSKDNSVIKKGQLYHAVSPSVRNQNKHSRSLSQRATSSRGDISPNHKTNSGLFREPFPSYQRSDNRFRPVCNGYTNNYNTWMSHDYYIKNKPRFLEDTNLPDGGFFMSSHRHNSRFCNPLQLNGRYKRQGERYSDSFLFQKSNCNNSLSSRKNQPTNRPGSHPHIKPSLRNNHKERLKKWKETRKQRKMAEGSYKPTSPYISPAKSITSTSDIDSSKSLLVQDLSTNSDVSQTTSKTTSYEKSKKNKQNKRRTSKSLPGLKIEKLRANNRLTSNNNTKVPSRSPFTSSSFSKPTTSKTSKSNFTSLNNLVVGEQNETERLRNKFRLLLDEIEIDNPTPVSSTTCIKTPAVNHKSSCLIKTDRKDVPLSEDNNPVHKIDAKPEPEIQKSTSGANKSHCEETNVESPSEIRGKLLMLAKRKQQEQAVTKLSSINPKPSIISSASSPEETQVSTGVAVDDSTDTNKKKDGLKPNLAKARCRLNNKSSHSTATSSDTDGDKHTRMANLLLKMGTRNKAHTNKNTSSNDSIGPRFGIGVLPHEPSSAMPTDESDLQELVETIEEVEGRTEDELECSNESVSAPTPLNDNTHRQHSHQPPSISYDTPPCPPKPKRPLVSDAPSKPLIHSTSELAANSARHSNYVASVVSPPPVKPYIPEKIPETFSSGNADDLSLKLLHMSEKEELLHSHDEEAKKKAQQLQDELDHVDSLIEQLLDRKKELQAAKNQVDSEVNDIKTNLENIRQNRLALLRASTSSSASTLPKKVHKSPSDLPRPESCTHSTPTPRSKSHFPDSQSSISDHSHHHQDASTSNVASNTLKKNVPKSVKTETSSDHAQPVFEEEPFPVPSESIYYDPSTFSPEKKAMSSSVDKILLKYLNDASAEREVTSSTAPENQNRFQAPISNDHHSTDHEVTSTTSVQHENTKINKPVRSVSAGKIATTPGNMKDKRIQNKRDPHHVKPALQQLSSKDITSSWVTAPEDSYNLKPTSKELLVSVTLSAEQNEIASLGATTFNHHSSSVVGVFVSDCGKLISCSKDKMLCIVDIKTGRLLLTYELPGSPFKTFFSNTQDASVMLYVVLIDESNERGALAQSSLHCIHIDLQRDHLRKDLSHVFSVKKLLSYDSCIMCIHEDHNLLYLGTRDGNVIIFCSKTDKIEDKLDCHSPHAICCVTTGMDGARMVLCCGSSDCRISVRDAADGLLLKTLLGHTKTVNCIQLNRNLAYSGASDRSVLVHNIQSGEIMYRFVGMHTGGIRSLFLHDDAVITLCMDKSVRVLKTNPCRVSGPVKPVSGIPLTMFLHFNILDGSWDSGKVSLAYVYVGCQDGKIYVVPLQQLAYKVPLQNINSSDLGAQTQVDDPATACPADHVDNLQCLWNNCGSGGFTNASSLLTHVSLFHATDSYKEKLNCCCVWGSCTHYFSSDLDTALDVHLHMDKHISDEVKRSRKLANKDWK